MAEKEGYLYSEEVRQHTLDLEKQSRKDEDNTYLHRTFKIELIEKIDYRTGDEWSEKEKEAIREKSYPLSDIIYEAVEQALKESPNLGLMELSADTTDYNTYKKIKALIGMGAIVSALSR